MFSGKMFALFPKILSGACPSKCLYHSDNNTMVLNDIISVLLGLSARHSLFQDKLNAVSHMPTSQSFFFLIHSTSPRREENNETVKLRTSGFYCSLYTKFTKVNVEIIQLGEDHGSGNLGARENSIK